MRSRGLLRCPERFFPLEVFIHCFQVSKRTIKKSSNGKDGYTSVLLTPPFEKFSKGFNYKSLSL